MKKLLFWYMNNKDGNISFAKRLTNYYGTKFSAKIAAKILKPVQSDIDAKIKLELRKILDKSTQIEA
jgi:hypothetical protein